jgi:hypothetical protein
MSKFRRHARRISRLKVSTWDAVHRAWLHRLEHAVPLKQQLDPGQIERVETASRIIVDEQVEIATVVRPSLAVEPKR